MYICSSFSYLASRLNFPLIYFQSSPCMNKLFTLLLALPCQLLFGQNLLSKYTFPLQGGKSASKPNFRTESTMYRSDTSYFYNYNTIDSQYDLVYISMYSYDAQGRQISKTSSIDGAIVSVDSTAYDAAGNLAYQVSLNYSDGELTGGTRYTSAYDGIFQTNYTSETFEDTSLSWVITGGARTLLTKDVDHNISELIAQSYNATNGTWQNIQRIYDIVWENVDSGMIKSFKEDVWLDSTWSSTSVSSGTRIGSNWVMEYDAEENGQLSPEKRTTESLMKVYAGPTAFSSKQEELYVNEAWQTTSREYVTLFPDGSVEDKQVAYYSPDSSMKITYYDQYGNQTLYWELSTYTYNGTIDSSGTRYTYTMDANHNITSYMVDSYIAGQWVKDYKIVWGTYLPYENPNALATASYTRDILRVYPNPASDYVYVNDAGFLRVLSLEGTEVYSGTVSQNAPLAVNQWPKGLYLAEFKGTTFQGKVKLFLK